MKKVLSVLIGLLIILLGCTDNNTDGNPNNSKKTRLIINNQSDVNIVNVNYASIDFGSISKGETSTKEVAQGTRYIYFSIIINDYIIDCRTDVVTCDEGQDTNFNMTNNTTVVETAGDTRITIRNLYNTLLSIPTNLRVSAVTENSISFLWNEVNSASGYNIYRAASQNGTYLKLNLNVLTATEYTDSTTAANVVYWYAVSTVINAIETAKSEALPAVTLIPAPANLQINTSTLSSIILTWNIVNGVGGYNVYRASSENGNYIKINTTIITSGTYIDTGLTSNTIYFYKVCAVVSVMEGTLSNPVSASTLIPAPAELRASAITNYSISLAWDNLSNVIGYNVYRSSSEYGTYNKMNTEIILSNEFTDTSVSSNTTYYYKVNAVTSNIESMHSVSIPVSTGIIVIGSNLKAKFDWLDANAESNTNYIVEISMNENISRNLSYSGKTGVIITLISSGSLFTIQEDYLNYFNVFIINPGVTMVLNNVALKGVYSSVVYVKGGTLIMNGRSKISGGSSYDGVGSDYSMYGIGVDIRNNGNLIMNGGEICDNAVTLDFFLYLCGSGVSILGGGTFIMNDGKIYNNISYYTNGGVCINGGTFIMKGGEIFRNYGKYSGGLAVIGNSTARMSGGVIYGINSLDELKNMAANMEDFSIRATLQYGTFVGDTFYRTGEIRNTNNTIRIVDGVLLTE